jgi:hypothetical protein
MYYALPYIKEKKLWTYKMPNPLNFTFDYQYAMMFAMLFYIPSEYTKKKHSKSSNIYIFMFNLSSFSTTFLPHGCSTQKDSWQA